MLKLNLRTNKSLYGNGVNPKKTYVEQTYKVNEVGILLVAPWNSHSCVVAEKIMHELSPKMNDFITKYR